MSETSMLIPCTGKITRAELDHVPTPPPTATHVLIPHATVVEALVDTLSHRQVSVVDEEFVESKDGMEMFTAGSRLVLASCKRSDAVPPCG